MFPVRTREDKKTERVLVELREGRENRTCSHSGQVRAERTERIPSGERRGGGGGGDGGAVEGREG